MTRLLHRVVMAVTAFGLPYGWLVMAATPAATITDWGVTTPGSEALVEGPLDLVAFVQAAEEEHVQGVAIRFLRDGWPFGERGVLSYRAGPLSAGRSNWGSRLNPTASWVLGGQAMPNGLYEVQTQAKVLTSTGQQWTEWRGHAIALQVPPPATALTLRSAANGKVEVSWRQVQLPDFIRYDVERSTDGMSWAAVASTASSDATRIIDAPPPGTWRYRTRVVRSDGQGGQLATTSAPVGIDQPLVSAPAGGGGAPWPAAVDKVPGTVTAPGPPPAPVHSAAPRGSAGLRPRTPALPPPSEDSYHRLLPYPKVGRQASEPQTVREGAREPGPSTISSVQSRLRDRQLLPIVGGLLLMITAVYVGWQLRR